MSRGRLAAANGVIVLLILLAPAAAPAQEFRPLRPIRGGSAGRLAGPVEQEAVRAALERIVAAWNTPELRAVLGHRFYDGDRLADALAAAPRDARLRLLAVKAMRVVRQELRGERRVSVLSVVARTQIELEDPLLGFRRIEGTNEYLFALGEARPR